MSGALGGGILADDDMDAVAAGEGFQARGEIDRVAQRRIGHALGRSHIARCCRARCDADADADGGGNSCPWPSPPRSVRVHLRSARRMASAACIEWRALLGVVKRRIPERHDAVADILVDGPSIVVDRRRQRGQDRIDQIGQFPGSSFSAILVKSRMSENITDNSRNSPPSLTGSPLRTISSTSVGAKYMPKV